MFVRREKAKAAVPFISSPPCSFSNTTPLHRRRPSLLSSKFAPLSLPTTAPLRSTPPRAPVFFSRSIFLSRPSKLACPFDLWVSHCKFCYVVWTEKMEALKACYGDGSSDSDSEAAPSCQTVAHSEGFTSLPPPPISLLDPPNFHGSQDLQVGQTARVRSFPHVDGNYVLHVYIPIHIPPSSKKEVANFLKKVSSQEPNLNVIDIDVPLNILCKSDEKLEQVALGREFHISLGRTVPIQVHQIDSMVSMLRQKLQTRHHYWIEFNQWEVFVNDDHTRTFLSIKVVQEGLIEITKQIESVNAIYKLHNLPEFYKDPRPHISLAWALGNISHSLKKVVDEELKFVGKSLKKCVFNCKFRGIDCKIGKKIYNVCKISD